MKLISTLLSLTLLIAALAFALANRQNATVSLWPLGVEVQAPLCLLTLGTLLLGILLGAVITWFSAVQHRRTARQLRREIAGLQAKIDDLAQTVIPPQANDTTYLPSSSRIKFPFRRNA